MYEDYCDDYDAYAAEMEAEMAAQAEAEAQAAAEAEMEAQYKAMMSAEAEAEALAEAEAMAWEAAEEFKKEYGLYPDEVRELARAKEEGRLRILPCKIQGIAYKLEQGKIVSGIVLCVQIYDSFTQLQILWDNFLEWVDADVFGKTIFATKEEAEKALKGVK